MNPTSIQLSEMERSLVVQAWFQNKTSSAPFEPTREQAAAIA